jgi:hypothetical protein
MRARLLSRLDEIGRALARDPQSLALLALGSCGQEIDRLDDWSDLDFFVIVEPVAKQRFIQDLWWLADANPLVFAHRNTVDGWKALSEDHVFYEFAVFSPDELPAIPFMPGRVVWHQDGFDPDRLAPIRPRPTIDPDWLAAEALSNILIGLKRFIRGEHLAGWQAIVVNAGEQAASALHAGVNGPKADPYNALRRIETRDPEVGGAMQALLGPIAHTPAAARALLHILDARFAISWPMKAEIERHLDMIHASE